MARAWTRPAEVRAWLDKRWQSGALLSAFAEGVPWQPLSIPLRGPAAGEIAERLAETQQWAAEWARAGRGSLPVEYKKVGGREVGANLIPCRAWIDDYERAWELLGVGAQVRRFSSLVTATAERCPRLVPWMTRRPVQTLRLADGFAILNRLRHRFGNARSMLMDRATLLGHRGQWVTEPRPTAAVLDLLDAEEAEFYRDLVEGAFGPSVRLEQERIRFAAIERALDNTEAH